MKRLRLFVPRAFIVAAVLCLAALGIIGWMGSSRLISPPRRALQDYHREILANPAGFGISVERWTGPQNTPCLIVLPARQPGTATKSRELRTRLAAPPPWGKIRGTVVLLHGHGGRKEDHLPICERFCAAGFRCLLVDLPGHGDNPGTIATFGQLEVPLVEQVLDDAAATFGFTGEPAFLFGVSQGGAIALQTAARHPERWSGVISVAAFAALDETVTSSTRRLHPAIRTFAPIATSSVSLCTWFRAGFSPSEIRPLDAAGRLTMATLLIHGETDAFIPVTHGERIFEALPSSSNKRLLRIAGAGHGRVLAADAANTYATCCEFLLSALPNRSELTRANP